MTEPQVSVIIPVYDAMPYLISCLSSVLEQSIGRDRLEVIAVDDGSTDGSGEQLDLIARSCPNVRVVHQGPKGGPSRSRNVGMDTATGGYLFFLDADDYLGTEALERMVAVAEVDNADIVTGRRLDVGGRKDHMPPAPRLGHLGIGVADYNSAVRRLTGATGWVPSIGLVCHHLVRRSFMLRRGLRFAEDAYLGGDDLFGSSQVGAAIVGTVHDYVCYYSRLREDGGNHTTRLDGTEAHIDAVERTMRRLDDGPALPGRRIPVLRGTVLTLTQRIFNERFLAHEPDVRERLVHRARHILESWLTPGVAAQLPALDRVKVHLIARGMEAELGELIRLVSAGKPGKSAIGDGRVYAAYPYFRDSTVGIPDQCFDITGELAVRHHLAEVSWAGSVLRLRGYAHLEQVDATNMATEVVLRNRFAEEERWRTTTMPTPELTDEYGNGQYDYGLAGFCADLDLDSVAAGRWSAFLRVQAEGVGKEIPLGGNRAAASIDETVQTRSVSPTGRAAATTVILSFNRQGCLTLDVSRAGLGVPESTP